MTTAVATLDRGFSGATTATPAIRELTMEELDWVAGGAIDWGEAFHAGVVGMVGGAVGGAVAGAIGGAFFEGVGALPGAAAGFVTGGVAGFVGGFISNVYDQVTGAES